MSRHFDEMEPSELLRQHLSTLQERPSGDILDLACGGGRNALFLAAQGCSVVACDRSSEALALVAQRAAARALEVKTLELDLEAVAEPLEAERYSAIVVFRYLHRPLFKNLKAALKPGGWVVYETFRRAQATLGRPKNPDFLLEDGELPQLFAGFEVVHHWEGLRKEPKQAIAQLVARKPGP